MHEGRVGQCRNALCSLMSGYISALCIPGNQLIAQCMAKSIHVVQLSKEKPNTMTSGRFQYVPSGHLGVDYTQEETTTTSIFSGGGDGQTWDEPQ